tara:strand:+ start:7727 stop:8044 length:318 start_codon:yes stop_codon:yes gene_type:complete
MYELPDEIWNYIKEFALDWKSSHKRKMKPILENNIVECYKEIYERWTYSHPVWQNTTDIILAEYVNNERLRYAPPPGLPLTSITWNVKGTGGWWCGYGWAKKRYI